MTPYSKLAPAVRDALLLDAVRAERVWQDEKFGPNRDLTLEDWWAVLAEEYGESSEEYTKAHFALRFHDTPENRRAFYLRVALMRYELIQTAASCICMIDGMDRNLEGSAMYQVILKEVQDAENLKKNVWREARARGDE